MKESLEIFEQEKIEKIMNNCSTVRLGIVDNGRPYILPLVYGYKWNKDGLFLYMHYGMRGRKNDLLKEGSFVCFEMDIDGGLMGEGGPARMHSRAFMSVMGEGTLHFATGNDEKRSFFDYIMRKQTGKDGWTYPDSYLAKAEVFWLRADFVRAAGKGMELE